MEAVSMVDHPVKVARIDGETCPATSAPPPLAAPTALPPQLVTLPTSSSPTSDNVAVAAPPHLLPSPSMGPMPMACSSVASPVCLPDGVSSSQAVSSPLPSSAPTSDDGLLLFTKRPVPPIRQPTATAHYPTSPLSSPTNVTSSSYRSPSFSIPSRASDGPSCPVRSPNDGSSLEFAAPPPSPPVSQASASPFQPVSLLSQILTTHSHKLNQINGNTAAGSGPHSAGGSPASSVPNSTASSPVGSTTQLHGIFRRRGSHGAGDAHGLGLGRVGEEDLMSEDAQTEHHLSPPRLPRPLSTGAASSSVQPSLGPSDLHLGGLTSSDSGPSSPVKRPGLTFVPAELPLRSASTSVPPSPTSTPVAPPIKKASGLTFAVTTFCARPEAMGDLPGPDRKLHEAESDEDDLSAGDDQDDDEEEDDDENDQDGDEDGADSAGYLEDSEGDTTDEEEDEDDDLESSPAERRRYRYKRHSLFGESDTDEDEDETDALAEDEDGSWKVGQRDSLVSNFSIGAAAEVKEPTRKPSLSRSTSLLRHRRSLSLKSKGPKKIAGPVPPLPTPTVTSTAPDCSSGPTRVVASTSKRTHFPTPLVFRKDHSAFPRSPVPRSTVRGGHGPRVRKGSRMAAGVAGVMSSGGEKSAAMRERLGRDDFLPTHLKSEEGKTREREREREGDSTTDHGGGSGRCSRHRSPPPTSAGKDKMREHAKRSRSAALSGEDRASASRRSSTDTGKALASAWASRPEPHAPAPILLRSVTAGPAPGVIPAQSSGLPPLVGMLTPVFFSDAEDGSRGPPPSPPPEAARTAARPHFHLPSQPASPRPLPLVTPPPSRRVSTSVSERRASLSIVCSAFRRPSDDLVASQPTLALDGTSPAPFSQSLSPASDVVGGSVLAQSLHKALGTHLPSPPPSTAIRPFSPPPSAPSSYRPSLASPELHSKPGRRRMSQPVAPDDGVIKSRPIACPKRDGSQSGGGWTDGC